MNKQTRCIKEAFGNMDLQSLIQTNIDFSEKRHTCQDCPYTHRTYVPPYISNDNTIMVVGEAPGQTEAETKTPFTGLSGQELRKIFREIGLDDTKISIINTLNCHPFYNETPEKVGIKLCGRTILEPFVYSRKPKIVVLAGSIALNYFFPKTSITEKRGSILRKNDITFIPVLHPAYCLRNPQTFSLLRKDLNRIHIILGNKVVENKDYKLIGNIDDISSYKEKILNSEVLATDIETNSKLTPFDEGAKIWTIAFSYGESKSVCFPLQHPEIENIKFKDECIKTVKEILYSPNDKVFHNGIFDVKFLKFFGYEVKNFSHDTMIMAHLLDENRASLSLKSLSSEYFESYSHEFSDDLKLLSLYNNEDSDNTLKLFKLFYSLIKENKRLHSLYKNILMPFCQVIIDMELSGILLDIKYSRKLNSILTEKKNALTELIHDEYPETVNINLSSPLQLSKLFFEKYKFVSEKKTFSGNASIDSEVLQKLAKRIKLAKYIVKYREYEKSITTYVKKFPEMVESDNRIRGKYNICGTVTGRLSSSKPNLQNIPRDKIIKKMFIAKEGYKLINVDASQAELRVACSVANEKNMIDAYNKGLDIHSLTASLVLNKKINDVTKEDRQKAKGVNFGFLYGASAEGFQQYAENNYELRLGIEKCYLFRKKFFESYPGLLKWYKDVEDEIRKTGCVVYPTGRIAHFPQAKGSKEIPPDIIRKGANYPVQGGSSDIILFTMIKLREYIKEEGKKANIIMTVHDSIGIDCEENIVDDIIMKIKDISTIDIPKYFEWLKVPMKFDFSVGNNLGEMTEI